MLQVGTLNGPWPAIGPLSQPPFPMPGSSSMSSSFSDKHQTPQLHHVIRSGCCTGLQGPSSLLDGSCLQRRTVLPGVWARKGTSRPGSDPVSAWPVWLQAKQSEYQQVRLENYHLCHCYTNTRCRALARDLNCRIFTLVRLGATHPRLDKQSS